MFRHKGKNRTYIHNLKLASLLSFVAGIVNVAGLFAVNRLTTNVTGHFAFFADQMVKKHYGIAVMYLIFIAAFLLGAFTSNFIVELMSQKKLRYNNVVPVAIEITIITTIALLSQATIEQFSGVVASLLLFAMGMQNALVTSISNAVVRTTHLTGLFTDLGIELSQLFFYRRAEQQKKLSLSIKLRLTIIACFFLGGVAGGAGFFRLHNKVLLIASAILTIALFYDSIKFKIVLWKRRNKEEHLTTEA